MTADPTSRMPWAQPLADWLPPLLPRPHARPQVVDAIRELPRETAASIVFGRPLARQSPELAQALRAFVPGSAAAAAAADASSGAGSSSVEQELKLLQDAVALPSFVVFDVLLPVVTAAGLGLKLVSAAGKTVAWRFTRSEDGALCGPLEVCVPASPLMTALPLPPAPSLPLHRPPFSLLFSRCTSQITHS